MNEFTKGKWVAFIRGSDRQAVLLENGGAYPVVADLGLKATDIESLKERKANCKLMAAAGTAASQLADDGYNAMEVMKALPLIMRMLDDAQINNVDQHIRRYELLQSLEVERSE